MSYGLLFSLTGTTSSLQTLNTGLVTGKDREREGEDLCVSERERGGGGGGGGGGGRGGEGGRERGRREGETDWQTDRQRD